jgi:integrase
VDLKAGVIRLRPEDTKTHEGRLIPLSNPVLALFTRLPRALDAEGQRVPYVFTHHGKRIRSIQQAFVVACRSAGIAGAVFHDLRHTFVTNMRRAGVDYFRIMAITGHRTMDVFKRYHTIDHGDLRQAMPQMDTYMDTNTSPAREGIG